jgi:hypothetical protein
MRVFKEFRSSSDFIIKINKLVMTRRNVIKGGSLILATTVVPNVNVVNTLNVKK